MPLSPLRMVPARNEKGVTAVIMCLTVRETELNSWEKVSILMFIFSYMVDDDIYNPTLTRRLVYTSHAVLVIYQ